MPYAHAHDITEADFDTAVLARSREVPVLVDFWAPWCGPCRSLKPLLEKLAGEYGGRFELAKLNSDEAPSVSARYAVRSIPAVKLFVDGEVVDEFTGALPEGRLRAFLDARLPDEAEKLRRQAASLADPMARAELLAQRQEWSAAFAQLLEVVLRDKADARKAARDKLVEWFPLCPDPKAVMNARRELSMYLN